jgi:hypothetical protein
VVEVARVMKDETRVVSEDQSIINVVVPRLVKVKRLSRMFPYCVRTYIERVLHGK